MIITVLYLLISPRGIDLEFNALRIAAMAREISRPNHGFPIYFYKDLYNHYGYPIPIFYGSISILPFALLVRLGISVITAYKLMTLTILWLAFCSAYLCIADLHKSYRLAFLGAFIYATQPLFWTELFVRAGTGAAFVFVFIPPTVLGYYRITHDLNTGIKDIFLLAFGMSGIITSHVTSTVIIVISLFAAYLIELINMDNRLVKTGRIAIAAVLSFLLCAWYLMPLMEQFVGARFVGSSVSSLYIPYEDPLALLFPMHLSIALESMTDLGLKFSMIGGAVWSMILLLIFLIKRKHRLDSFEKLMLGIYVCIIASLLFHWSFLEKYISFIQFAWRIFLVASLAEMLLNLSLLSGFTDEGFYRFRIRSAIIVSGYVIVFFFGYYAVRNCLPSVASGLKGTEVSAYEYVESTETTDELYLPLSINKEMVLGEPRAVRPESDLYTCTIDEETGRVTIVFSEMGTPSDMVLTCPFIMYKGYTAQNNTTGESYTVSMSDDGLVDVLIPEGTTGEVTVSYTGTNIQRISYYISILSVLGCIIMECRRLASSGTLQRRKAGHD